MPKEYYECVVCGRKFPKGQGIVIERAGIKLTFHSKACLTKFFKLFVERIEEQAFKRASREVLQELKEVLENKYKPKTI